MPHKQLIGTVVTPVQTLGTKIKNGFSDFFASMTKYNDVVKENEELKKLLTEKQSELDEFFHLESENERLKNLIGIKEANPEFEFVAADVVSRSTDGWDGTITINVGTSDGIKKKNVVLTGQGLVGLVTDVGYNWATVTTVLDPRIAVGAIVSRTNDIGMTEGSAELKADGLCRLSYMETNVSVNRGDTVKTSGLGGTYPKDLPIGIISDIVIEEHGLSMYALIKPYEDIMNVRRVYIITNFDNAGVLDEE